MVAKVGDTIPDVKFNYIPYSPEQEGVLTCGLPSSIQTHKAFANKKVVIVAAPGAFTGTCSERHIPDFVAHSQELVNKGADEIVVIAGNDMFVMSAWGRALGANGNIKFANDPAAEFSKALGLDLDLGPAFGPRTGRYALIVDNLKIKYVGKEQNDTQDVTVSGYDAVLKALH